MNNPVDSRKRNAARIALAALTLHVIVAMIMQLMITSGASHQASSFSRKFILLGPYFSEPSIKSSYHLFVSTYENGRWSLPKDYAQEVFNTYCAQPWRYDKLHLRDFAKSLAWQNIPAASGARSPETFQRMITYVKTEWVNQSADSIALNFSRKTFRPTTNTFDIDTLFTSVHAFEQNKSHEAIR